MVKMNGHNGQMRLGEYVPTPETENKSFQKDTHGNFRITVKGIFSEWKKNNEIAVLKVDADTYIGVTNVDLCQGDFPKGCSLRIEIVDEDGDANFYKFKVVDIITDEVLDADDMEYILRNPFEEDDYIFNIKESRLKGFVKIAITDFSHLQEHKMTKEEVEKYLTGALPSEDYDVINEEGIKINNN